MDKKIIMILLIFLGLIGFMFISMNRLQDDNDKDETYPSSVNQTSTDVILNDIKNVNLYVTDYKYDSTINGYHYQQVTLDNYSLIKEVLAGLNLDNKTYGTVYGKYKLVVDNKTIFFDSNNDIALFADKNIVFKFPKEIKSQIVTSTDNCSCCAEKENCKINLCSCLNNKTN